MNNIGIVLLNISTADRPIPVAPPVRTTTLSLSVASNSALNSILDILEVDDNSDGIEWSVDNKGHVISKVL